MVEFKYHSQYSPIETLLLEKSTNYIFDIISVEAVTCHTPMVILQLNKIIVMLRSII
jgi:hypothetical protein